MAVNSRRASTPNAAALVKGPSPASTPPPGGKSRARDLLRKHYGLGVGPPPPPPGPGKSPSDPMDLGMFIVLVNYFVGVFV